MLDLIGKSEGTDKGRGYNETLGYGMMLDGRVTKGKGPTIDLFQNARKAAREGKNQDALDWLLVAVSHDEGAQNVLRENFGEVIRRLVG